MKRYKLLKDLPEVEAGAIFAQQGDGGLIIYEIPNSDDDSVHFYKHMIKNFDEWFEEIESQEYFYINNYGNISQTSYKEYNVRPYKPKTQSETMKKNGEYI